MSSISFILPFYKKADLFASLLPVNDCFASPDSEVILVLDDPSDEIKVLETIARHPEVKFRVIVNDWPHVWRPPCIAYNVGARHASGDHLVLTDPEIAFVLPTPDFFQRCVREDYRMCIAGLTWNWDDYRPEDGPAVIRHKLQVCEAINYPWWFTYGTLLVPRYAFERVCGFDESRKMYGHDDMDLRIRLVRMGYRCLVDGRVKAFHIAHDCGMDRTCHQTEPMSTNIVLSGQANSWGKAFSRIAYDYK